MLRRRLISSIHCSPSGQVHSGPPGVVPFVAVEEVAIFVIFVCLESRSRPTCSNVLSFPVM